MYRWGNADVVSPLLLVTNSFIYSYTILKYFYLHLCVIHTIIFEIQLRVKYIKSPCLV